MPDVSITIGQRQFIVACQTGEERFLQSAAALLDAEASQLVGQIGRMPEARMLLMAGLMLADKTAGLEEKLREAEERALSAEGLAAQLRAMPKPEPERIEVPVIPPVVTDTLAEIAARAEALAEAVEERLRG